jgi:hypothetical protein
MLDSPPSLPCPISMESLKLRLCMDLRLALCTRCGLLCSLLIWEGTWEICVSRPDCGSVVDCSPVSRGMVTA